MRLIWSMENFNTPGANVMEAEVKKLQDLVRKLEVQNQQLRNKNKSPQRCVLSTHGHKVNSVKLSSENDGDDDCTRRDHIKSEDVDENLKDCINYLDEVEIIRISDVDTSDDDCWLYTSPKGLTPEQKNESPYKWLRKDVDDPNNKELQLAKKALITKLNELDILSPVNQMNKTYPLENHAIQNRRRPQISYKHHLSPKQENKHYSSVNTRTFTKSMKKEALDFLSSKGIESHWEVERSVELRRRDSDVSLDSSTGTYTLNDANDVQEVARMQEESLRLNSPIGTPKRQSSSASTLNRRLSITSRSSLSDLDSMEQPVLMSQISRESQNAEAVTASGPLSCPVEANHSDQSSPSQSPYGSNISLDNITCEKGDTCRRSLPNLARNSAKRRVIKPQSKQELSRKSLNSKYSASGRKSDSNLLPGTKLKRETSPARQMLRQPMGYISASSTGPTPQYSHSRGRAPQTYKTVDNPRTNVPVKSGLPRPSRAASATRVMSGIPVPSTFSKRNIAEDSWSDGCF